MPIVKNIRLSNANNQKSLNDDEKYAKQLGQLFFSKISYNYRIKLILKLKVY